MNGIIFSPQSGQQDNRPASLQMLNQCEITTIRSLILYVATAYSKSEAFIEATTLEKFKADSVDNIARADFDAAVRYLVDLQPNELVN